MSTSPSEPGPLLVFAAHPDDAEFGCGGILAAEARTGRTVHLVVGSRGESGSNGTPEQRTEEAKAAAVIMGVSVEFLDLGGDSNIEPSRENARKLAAVIRRVKPTVVFAPTLVTDQHPDHTAVAVATRDAARLARYGNVPELKREQPHAIEHLFYYAITPDTEPRGERPLLFTIDDTDVETWKAAMSAHASQLKTRNYVDLQIMRARLKGENSGCGHAIALFPNDPLRIHGLSEVGMGSRRF